MALRVAVVGATGNVGQEILNILHERLFPADEVFAIASRRSIGRRVSYGDTEIKCHDIETFDFSTVDLCLMSAGSKVAMEWAPKITLSNCIVIDNSSAFRMDPLVPLVVPEVNADAVMGYEEKYIIANPNCSTAQLVVALKPIHDKVGVERVVVSTYQSTSGAGKAAMDELWNQTRGIFVNDSPTPREFTKQIAFNVIPHIDEFMEDGRTREEWKMEVETKKILDPDIELVATCVRVPTFVGHAEAVHIEMAGALSAEDATALFRESPGIMVNDKREDEGYITPVECVGEWATFISRIREDKTVDHGLAFWCVADNLRKGAALNAVQIAEELINRGVLKPSLIPIPSGD
jgi:aspartate-semialdehyde dehydrogenase